MARISFTLRRPTTDADLGSYLRYDNAYGVRTDYDSALKADGLLIAPTAFSEATFEVLSSAYGEAELNWQISMIDSSALTATPDVTGIVLVYSPLGAPQTLASGDILVESTNTYSYVHTGLTEGRWAYYTLFVHYESTLGDSYYEKAASLAVLVPKYYGSNLALWKRIPEYYRSQDTSLGNYDYEAGVVGGVDGSTPIGPLFKFLSVFGFEMDRVRTILDYQMMANDPSIANYEHLDAISQELGVDLLSQALGSKRLRSLLNEIGYFRRSKGTLVGTEFAGKALAASDIEVNQTTGAIKVYSQRVNYITVPKTGAGIITHRPAFNAENATPALFSTSTGVTGTYTVTGAGSNVFTPTGSGASVGVEHVLLHSSSPVPVQLGDRVYFSVQSGVGTAGIVWARLVNAAGTTTMGFQRTALSISGSKSFEITVDTAASVGVWTNSYVEYLVDLRAVPTFTNGSLLAERNYLGTYFDGSTVRGGWLIDSASVSDYRWAGSANNSVSIFAEDYGRTKSVLSRILFDILPITEVSKYTITSYNAVPGF